MVNIYTLTAINEAANKLMLNVDVNLLQESSLTDLQRAESKRLIYENIQFVKTMMTEGGLIQEGRDSLAMYWGGLIQESLEDVIVPDRIPAMDTGAAREAGNAMNQTLTQQDAAHTNQLGAAGNAMNNTLAQQDAKIAELQKQNASLNANANQVAGNAFNQAEMDARNANNTPANLVKAHAESFKDDLITKANEVAANNPSIGNAINTTLATKDQVVTQGTDLANKTVDAAKAGVEQVKAGYNTHVQPKIDAGTEQVKSGYDKVVDHVANNAGAYTAGAAGLAGVGAGVAGANIVRRRQR